MTPPSAQLAALELRLNVFRDSGYFNIACLVFTAYDHILTLADEIDWIYSGPMRASKWLFLLNRYSILIIFILRAIFHTHVFPRPVILNYTYFEIGANVYIHILVNCVLSLRVYALYNKSRAARAFLIGWLALYTAAASAAAALSDPPKLFTRPINDPAPILAVSDAIDFFFELVIYALTLFQTLRIQRSRRSSAFVFRGVVDHLQAQGTRYFVLIAAVLLVGMVAAFSPAASVIFGTSGMTIALSSALCSRMLLALQHELRSPRDPILGSLSVSSGAAELAVSTHVCIGSPAENTRGTRSGSSGTRSGTRSGSSGTRSGRTSGWG